MTKKKENQQENVVQEDVNALGVSYDVAAVVGERLRQAREDHVATKDQMAKRAKIRERYIGAIESGDWDILPPGLNGRGLVRLYARELDVALPEFEDFSGFQMVQVEKESERLRSVVTQKKSRYQPAAEESAELIRVLSRKDYEKMMGAKSGTSLRARPVYSGTSSGSHASVPLSAEPPTVPSVPRYSVGSGNITTPKIEGVLGIDPKKIQHDDEESKQKSQEKPGDLDTLSDLDRQENPNGIQLKETLQDRESFFDNEDHEDKLADCVGADSPDAQGLSQVFSKQKNGSQNTKPFRGIARNEDAVSSAAEETEQVPSDVDDRDRDLDEKITQFSSHSKEMTESLTGGLEKSGTARNTFVTNIKTFFSSLDKKKTGLVTGIVAVFVAVIGGGVFFYSTESVENSRVSPTQTLPTTPIVVDAAGAQTGTDAKPQDLPKNVAKAESTQSATQQADSVKSNVIVSDGTQVSGNTSSQKDATAQKIALTPSENVMPLPEQEKSNATAAVPAEGRRVMMTLTAPVFIRVSSDGKVIYQGTQQKGELNFRFHKKVEIFLNDGSLVRLKYGDWDMGVMGTPQRKRKIVLMADGHFD